METPPNRRPRDFRCSPRCCGLDRLDGLLERARQDTLADHPDNDGEHPSLEVLALADDDDVHVGRPVVVLRQGVAVPRMASPDVGVGCCQDDMVGIGPVVVQALPDAARALRHVGMTRTLPVHLEVVVGAVAEQLRAARPEVRESGDELLGGRRGCLFEMDRGQACSFLSE